MTKDQDVPMMTETTPVEVNLEKIEDIEREITDIEHTNHHWRIPLKEQFGD